MGDGTFIACTPAGCTHGIEDWAMLMEKEYQISSLTLLCCDKCDEERPRYADSLDRLVDHIRSIMEENENKSEEELKLLITQLFPYTP